MIKIKNSLFLTAHDYRTPRKVDLHFMADSLAKAGQVRFFSIRYSLLSKYRPDGRHIISNKANVLEQKDGVDCFLWKSIIHPINTRIRYLSSLESIAFWLYSKCAPTLMKRWMKEAEVIFFESGTAPVFFELAKRLNPNAKLIYLASDGLESINSAKYVREEVKRISPLFHAIWLPSPLMKDDFQLNSKFIHLTRAFDSTLKLNSKISPYSEGINAVSIGSMLFDMEFIKIVAELRPDINFHIIGCGIECPDKMTPNVIFYPEMDFNDTIPFIAHATFGIAPYLVDEIPMSLADTSMKLFQYTYLGIPALCPLEVVGNYPHRFGYDRQDNESIATEVENLLCASNEVVSSTVMEWDEFVEKLLDFTYQ